MSEDIEVIDKDYPDNQIADIDLEVNSDLINTRGEGDELAD